MPSAQIVFGSKGHTPATPRIPSVPNNRFPMNVLMPVLHDVNLHSNLRRVQNPYLRFLRVDRKGLYGVTGDIRQIEWVGLQFARTQHMTLRPADFQPRWLDLHSGHGESRG